MNQNLWAFTIYTLVYEAVIWGVFGYAVFGLGFSGWWVLLAVFLSGSQLKPQYFGLPKPD